MPKGVMHDGRVLNCFPSREPEKDWLAEISYLAGIVEAPASLAPSMDLREAWWPVGDQKNTGSCVGWATADGVLRWHFVKANRFPADSKVRLSPRFTWMASKECDQYRSRPTTFIEVAGTYLKDALEISRSYGAVLDAVLPFEGGSLFQGDENTFFAIASQMRIGAYYSLGTNQAEWKKWLVAHGPILTRLDVENAWMNATNTQGALKEYDPQSRRGGHAVAIVGYTPDCFIVRNSWGADWGDKGFAYASIAYAAAAFTEAWGITL